MLIISFFLKSLVLKKHFLSEGISCEFPGHHFIPPAATGARYLSALPLAILLGTGSRLFLEKPGQKEGSF